MMSLNLLKHNNHETSTGSWMLVEISVNFQSVVKSHNIYSLSYSPSKIVHTLLTMYDKFTSGEVRHPLRPYICTDHQ